MKNYSPNNRDRGHSVALCAILIVLTALSGNARSEILANQNKRGLRAFTIEGVLRLQEDQIDLGTAALILSRDWGTNKTSHVYRRKIDDMAEEIIRRLKSKHIPKDYRAIGVINAYLFDELGFSAVKNADDPDDLFLHVVVERKQGYCLSLSVLYLAIAERVGLPMYGVVVPGHFFVRYDDGTRRYNIETTSNGAIAPDEHYIDRFKPPKRLKTLYMRNLTKKQTLGCFFNNLGNCYLDIGDTDRAFDILSDAVAINPLLSEAHMNLGNIYLQKNVPHKAISKYQQALAILGQDEKAFSNLGTAYMQIGEYRKAESYYKTSLSLSSDNVDVYQNLARALYMQDEDQKAISYLETALKMNPDNIESILFLGQIYQKLQETKKAFSQLNKVIALDTSNASARNALGLLYLDANQAEQAIIQFQTVIDLQAANAQTYFGMARAYNRLGQTDQEIHAYENALSLSPGMTAALQNLGNAYLKKGMHDEAISVYQEAISLNPQNAAVYYNLGVALAGNQQHQPAISEYLTAIQLDSSRAEAYNGIAISYYQMGEYESARIYARKAKDMGVDVDPTLLK
ncbi:MAG: tetratricopeptide repeat protein [Planctomycetes bacterium]|nr:tetratricopeptide repeat protein [Planctomycetota bacterium]